MGCLTLYSLVSMRKDIELDEEDLIELGIKTASVCKTSGYLYVVINSKPVLIHKAIMKPEKGQHVDHRDRNKLNNKRSNLRLATARENSLNQGVRSSNTSGFKGVYFDKKARMWCARIRIGEARLTLGRFYTAELAAEAYNKAAVKHHGDFACLNKIGESHD